MSLITIFGGSFRDASGNLNAGGLLTLRLTADAQSPVLDYQVFAGAQINITLDNTANVPNAQIESNATIAPDGTGYIANLYDPTGRQVWLRPAVWVFPNANTDLGSIVPAVLGGPSMFFQPIVTTPPGDQSILNDDLLPAPGNLTQSLGSNTAPWNATLNQLNVGNTAVFANYVSIANAAINVATVASLNANIVNANVSGLILSYNNIALQNSGIPSLVGTVHLANYNLNVANTALYLTPSTGNGLYKVAYYAKVTTPGSTSGSIGPGVVTWTDQDGVILTLTLPAVTPTGSVSTSAVSTNTNATFLIGQPVLLSCLNTTNINLSFTYASVGATNLRYSLHATCEALG